MTAKFALKIGKQFPFDMLDDESLPPQPTAADYAAARGIIADLQDRRGIKQGFNDIDEETRIAIVNDLAAIIREAYKNASR